MGTSTQPAGVRLMMAAQLTDLGMQQCAQLCAASMREGRAWATSTCGQVATVARTTIATATATPPPCGPFPSTQPSTPARTPTTTRAVPPPLPPPSPTEPRTPTRGSPPPTSTGCAPRPTQGHQPLLLRPQEFLPWPSRPTVG